LDVISMEKDKDRKEYNFCGQNEIDDFDVGT
jgi:hypothetical protein